LCECEFLSLDHYTMAWQHANIRGSYWSEYWNTLCYLFIFSWSIKLFQDLKKEERFKNGEGWFQSQLSLTQKCIFLSSQWFTPIILATSQAEIIRIMFQGQPWPKKKKRLLHPISTEKAGCGGAPLSSHVRQKTLIERCSIDRPGQK
jgi:hypothetical protein